MRAAAAGGDHAANPSSDNRLSSQARPGWPPSVSAKSSWELSFVHRLQDGTAIECISQVNQTRAW